MRISDNYIDRIYNFRGLWNMPSRCGLKLFKGRDKIVILVTELYQENPGSSITRVSRSLMEQICTEFKISFSEAIYVECAPAMNSKLSFYEQEFFMVDFATEQPEYIKIENLQNFLSKHG